jgi:23S rRNA pseudouridine2605 synthase
MATVRLQKVLAQAGLASRRAAEAMITAGRVRVDGRVVTELGTKVDPRASRVEVDGQRIVAEDRVYVVLHKPRGVVSTMSDPEGRPSVRELLKNVPGRVYPVGRLDFATSGVLLATNDGDFAEALMHPRKAVPKTYVVKANGEMQTADLDAWRRGVQLEDGKTLPARVRMLRHEAGKTWFELTITEGRNQQVRRMGEATGFRVMRLARVEVAGITGDGLRPGDWRYLTMDELTAMKKEYGFPKKVVPPPPQPTPTRRAWSAPRDEDDMDTRPRYGGGAPARRDPGVREDWGGGVRRGASGARDAGASHGPPRRGQQAGARPPRPEVGGRGGSTRTTGTGGGIGGDDASGSYRVRGRRG